MEREIRKDPASLAAKSPTENALPEAGPPEVEKKGSLLICALHVAKFRKIQEVTDYRYVTVRYDKLRYVTEVPMTTLAILMNWG